MCLLLLLLLRVIIDLVTNRKRAGVLKTLLDALEPIFEEVLGRSIGLLLSGRSVLPFVLVLLIFFASQSCSVETAKVLVELRVLSLHFVPDCIDVLELPWELWQAVEELLDHDDSEALAFSLAPKGFDHEFQRNILKNIVQQLVFDDCAKELGDLFEVLLRVPVQEAVLVK